MRAEFFVKLLYRGAKQVDDALDVRILSGVSFERGFGLLVRFPIDNRRVFAAGLERGKYVVFHAQFFKFFLVRFNQLRIVRKQQHRAVFGQASVFAFRERCVGYRGDIAQLLFVAVFTLVSFSFGTFRQGEMPFNRSRRIGD